MQSGAGSRKWNSLAALVAVGLLVAGCSSSAAKPTATGASSQAGTCAQGSWRSSSMVAPAQAGIQNPVPTGGGDGANITFAADGTFLVDFGPMKPALATFKAAGQDATMTVVLSGVGKGPWRATGDRVVASFADLTTVRASATLTLGTTVPPVFDDTLQHIDATMMLDNHHMGLFTVTKCAGNAMTMITDFPNGILTIDAKRA